MPLNVELLFLIDKIRYSRYGKHTSALEAFFEFANTGNVDGSVIQAAINICSDVETGTNPFMGYLFFASTEAIAKY